ELDGVEPSRLETAVLHRDAARERGDAGDDPVLEVQDRKLTDNAPARFEYAPEHDGVARLVGALARETHARLPILAREVAEVAGAAFEAIDLLVHLPVEELELPQRMVLGKIGAVGPALGHCKARVARGAVREQAGIEGRARRVNHRAGPRPPAPALG